MVVSNSEKSSCQTWFGGRLFGERGLPPLCELATFPRVLVRQDQTAQHRGFGHDVPLVPRNRLSASLDLSFPYGLSARVDHLRVSNQVLANDDANGQTHLGGYRLLNARAAWRPIDRNRAGRGGGSGGRTHGSYSFGALELFVEAHNILDERYATRGIYAFAGVPPASTIFVTPAPDRTLIGGATVAF